MQRKKYERLYFSKEKLIKKVKEEIELNPKTTCEEVSKKLGYADGSGLFRALARAGFSWSKLKGFKRKKEEGERKSPNYSKEKLIQKVEEEIEKNPKITCDKIVDIIGYGHKSSLSNALKRAGMPWKMLKRKKLIEMRQKNGQKALLKNFRKVSYKEVTL